MATSDLLGNINQAAQQRKRQNSFDITNTPSAQRSNPLAANLPPVTPAASARQPPTNPIAQLPAGVGATPQQMDQRQRATERQQMGQAITQTRQNVGQAVDRGIGFVGDTYKTIGSVATTVPRALANTTFDDRLPGQANREAAQARQRSQQNADWVTNNPEQAQAAQAWGQGIADRARQAGLAPPGGPRALPAGAEPPAPQGAAIPPSPGQPTETPQASSMPGIGQTMPGQSVAPQNTARETYASGIAKPDMVDGIPTFTNEHFRGFDPSRVNTISSEAMSSVSPSTSARLAQARSAAVARGESVPGVGGFQPNKGGFTVVRDSTAGSGGGSMERAAARRESRINTQPLNSRAARAAANVAVQQQANQIRSAESQQRATSDAQRSMDSGLDRNLREREMGILAQDSEITRQRTGQQIAAGALEMQQSQRLEGLQQQMMDQSLSEAERAQARRQYEALTTSGKDRLRSQTDLQEARQRAITTLYGQYSANPPYDGNNNPIPFEIWAQPAMDAMGQGQRQPRALPAGATRESAVAEARAAIQSGAPREAVNQRLAGWGIDPI